MTNMAETWHNERIWRAADLEQHQTFHVNVKEKGTAITNK